MCRSEYTSACYLSVHPRPFTPRQQPPTIPSLPLLALLPWLCWPSTHAFPPPFLLFPLPYHLLLLLDLAFSYRRLSSLSFLSFLHEWVVYPLSHSLITCLLSFLSALASSYACSILLHITFRHFPSLFSFYFFFLFLIPALSYALAFPFLWFLSL